MTSSQFTPFVIHLSHIFISFLNQIVCEADSLVITNTLEFLSPFLHSSHSHSVPLITSTQFISRFLSSGINDNVAHGRKPERKKIYLSFPANFTCPYIYTFSIHFTLNFYLRICTFHLAYKKNFEQKWNILSDNTPLLPLLLLFCCRVNLNRQYDGLLAPATSHNLPPFFVWFI